MPSPVDRTAAAVENSPRQLTQAQRVVRPAGLEFPPPEGPIPRYLDEQRRSWARQWPHECIWKARKQ